MKKIEVTNWKRLKISGDWNEKFYEPQIEGDSTGIFRIYVNGERVHITKEEKEKLIESINYSKIEQDNVRIGIIKEEFSRLDDKAKKMLLEFLSEQI